MHQRNDLKEGYGLLEVPSLFFGLVTIALLILQVSVLERLFVIPFKCDRAAGIFAQSNCFASAKGC